MRADITAAGMLHSIECTTLGDLGRALDEYAMPHAADPTALMTAYHPAGFRYADRSTPELWEEPGLAVRLSYS